MLRTSHCLVIVLVVAQFALIEPAIAASVAPGTVFRIKKQSGASSGISMQSGWDVFGWTESNGIREDLRAFLEFDAAEIADKQPSTWNLTLVWHYDNLDPISRVESVAVYGYEADGLESIDDFDAGVLVGTLAGRGAGTADLSSFVNTGLAQNWSHIGLALRVDFPNELGLVSSRPTSAPPLKFTPVPEPSALMLLLLVGGLSASRE